MVSDDQLIGKQLANYRIERRLGQGGMASVYYATDVNLHRPVAIKLIDSRYQGDSDIARRFVDEARLIARWRHENVIQVYYAGQEENIFFFAMEYIEGLSLAELMADYRASRELMPYPDVLKIARAVAEALDYAHEQGVIHRDVKPSNVMISTNDRVVLTDFGLALDMERGTLGEIFGTPHYIAPEQVRSSAEVVPQSDLYALGVILFEMLTGSVPFDDPSAATLALKHLNEPPPPPCSINPLLNPAIEKVLLKALEKEAGTRYQTGVELVDTLEAALKEDVSPTTGQPNISGMSVADKITLHLSQQQSTSAISPSASSSTTQRTQTAKEYKTQPARGINRGLLTATIIAVLLVIGIGGFALLGNNLAGSPTSEMPTLAASSTDTVKVAAVGSTDTPVLSQIPQTTTLPSQTQAQVAVVPSNTLVPTTAPTSTLAPTTTPVPTNTPVPPTAVPQQAANTPVSTVLYPNGRRIELFWDENSFYAWNGSGSSIRVSPFRFEALDESGNPVPFSFDGGQWSVFFGAVENNKCDRIEIGRASGWLRPAQCRGYNSTINPLADDPMVFWTGLGESTHFRILWHNQEVARCEITAETCHVLLPTE